MRSWRALRTGSGALKSMSATHIGRISLPAYFCHFWLSVWRRSGLASKRLSFGVLIIVGKKDTILGRRAMYYWVMGFGCSLCEIADL